MATINFFGSRAAELQASTDVILKYTHIPAEHIERYTYIDANGVEQDYMGTSVTHTSDGGCTGKIINTHKVKLQYHPEVVHVDGYSSYFSYIDADGNVKVFSDEPSYDAETNTYFCEIHKTDYVDNKVDLYLKD